MPRENDEAWLPAAARPHESGDQMGTARRTGSPLARGRAEGWVRVRLDSGASAPDFALLNPGYGNSRQRPPAHPPIPSTGSRRFRSPCIPGAIVPDPHFR